MKNIYKKFLRLLEPFDGFASLLVSISLYYIALSIARNFTLDTAFLIGGLSALFVDCVITYLKKLGE
jgi:hypothetical protein